MGILRNGIFGPHTGKLGNMVSYVVNGRNVTRIIGKNKKAASVKQCIGRKEMGVVTAFLKTVKAFVAVGFELVAATEGMYAQNKAVSYNKVHALKGWYPDIEIDFERLMLSMGDLPQLHQPEVQLNGSVLRFAWTSQPGLDWERQFDRVMLMAYLPEVELATERAWFVLSGEQRSVGLDCIALPPALAHQRMELYISVMAADHHDVSDSQYLGRLN